MVHVLYQKLVNGQAIPGEYIGHFYTHTVRTMPAKIPFLLFFELCADLAKLNLLSS